MRFLLISPKNRTVYNFRGELIRAILGRGHLVTVTGPDNTDIDKIQTLGVNFAEIPMRKNGTSIPEDLKYCLRLYRLMRSQKPDVTLGYTIKPVVYGAIAAKLAGVRTIASMVTGAGYTFISGSPKAKVLGRLVSLLYKTGLACSSRVIFHNADDRDEFVQRGLVKAGKCQVVNGSGVNMDYFAPAPMPERITFFMLSRLLKSKGVLEYMQAARLVKELYPQARFLLLGSYDSLQDALTREQIESYFSDGTVERFDEAADVRPYYSQCSVYVLPSYREGTPRTVLEAMAMGRPIITTDTNGCRQTMQDGVNGFLVPVRDVAALVEKMIWYIENPQQIEVMGRESLRICREKFDVNEVNKVMLRIMGIEGAEAPVKEDLRVLGSY